MLTAEQSERAKRALGEWLARGKGQLAEVACRRLQTSGGDLWRLVSGKDKYGQSWHMTGTDARPMSYDAAVAKALEKLGKDLEFSGLLCVFAELEATDDR